MSSRRSTWPGRGRGAPEALVNQVDSNGFSRNRCPTSKAGASSPATASYAALVTKFQNKFDGPEQITRILMHCQKKGTHSAQPRTPGRRGRLHGPTVVDA